jgi:hypothetical protein
MANHGSYQPNRDSAGWVRIAAREAASTTRSLLPTPVDKVLGDIQMRVDYQNTHSLTDDYSEAPATRIELTSGSLPGATFHLGEPTAPSTVAWSPAAAGSYPFSVRVTFADGHETTSAGTIVAHAVPSKSLAVKAIDTTFIEGSDGNYPRHEVTFNVVKTQPSGTTPNANLYSKEDPASDGFWLDSGDADSDGVLDFGETWQYVGAVYWWPEDPTVTKTRTVQVFANDKTGAREFLETESPEFTVSR